MRILVTGIIAGLEDRAWLRRVCDSAGQHGIDIAYFDVVDRLTRGGEKPMERLLGTTDYILELIREREYERIGFEIEKHGHENVIVRAPATVEWNRINRKFKDSKYIREFIAPDLIVTLIDAEWLIKKRLEHPPEADKFLQVIKERNHTIYEVLAWMNEEVSLSEDWAKIMGVRHIVMAVGEPPQNLISFFADRDAPVYYASYSMTHSEPLVRGQITAFIERLREYGVVIDPQKIEIATGDLGLDLKDKEATYSFTVHRDLHWYVGKCDAVVAIHPYLERPPLSTGMMDELGHARDYHKGRYMIFPRALSPFVTDSYIEKGHVFDTGEQFFRYLQAVEKRTPQFRFLYHDGGRMPLKNVKRSRTHARRSR